MKRINRILSILLILTLIVPGFAFAGNQDSITPDQEALFNKVLSKINSDIKLGEKYDDLFEPEEEVRIIVELESNPTVVYATESNMGYKDMAPSRVQGLERSLEIEQNRVKDKILSNNIGMEFINSYKTAFNGFSGKVKYEDIKLIENLPSVRRVYISNEYERPEIEPDMGTSHDMIGSIPTWNTGYKGEGTVISIIDTGIDPSHRDMVLSPGVSKKLSKANVEALDLLGKYFTEKVPYGYNYYDLNNDVVDIGPGASMHGMHVAGTAGANGDTEEGGIKGVAPESQLLAMKVFSNDPIYATTFSDIYLVAIDESIRLGADVLNMSLGSTASFYIPESAEDVALRNASENGVVCSVSAGNSGAITYGWTNTNSGFPWVENPDIGVVGAPGLNKHTIQVASIENTHSMANALSYKKDGEIKKAAMAIAGSINPANKLPGEQEFVDVNDGSMEFMENVAGKVVVAVRGGNTGPFTDKIENAQAAGAAAIIVRNHEAGGEELINMATPDEQTIPAVFIGYTDGLALLGLEDKKVTFTNDPLGIPNPDAYEMSDFTSWGVTPSLEFKPEITAPGGRIYSTLNNDSYGTMSGTSMAAPHVAGGSALVMEYIKSHDEYKKLSLAEQTKLAKVLLMNTATIRSGHSNVLSGDKFVYSPRRQGAGLMNLYGAVNTPVRLVEANTNEAKVELKDFDQTEFIMNFKAINDSDTDVTYVVDTLVLTDFIYANALNLLSSDEINADVTHPTTITVPANDEVAFQVKVDISPDTAVYRNMFVEGFVSLKDPADNNPELSIPYVGFYGDWGEPDILDGMRFIDPAGYSYFGASGILYWDINDDGYYYGQDKLYMSPGTLEGLIFGTGGLTPYLSFMRNAEKVHYRILDSQGKELRTIHTEEYVRKNYIDGGRRQPVRFVWNAEWDGKVDGSYLADGEYFYEIAAKVHYDGAQYQSKKIPVVIDTVAPEITKLKYNEDSKKLTWEIEEDNGLAGIILSINGEDLDDADIKETDTGYEVDLSDYLGELNIEIIALDYAMNMGRADIQLHTDRGHGNIFILSPGLLNVYDDSEVLFEGYVTNFVTLDKVIINGNVEANIEYVDEVVIKHPDDPSTTLYKGPAYKFIKTVELEDGYKEVKVEAISKSGNRSSLVRRIYVDTTAPEMTINVKSVANGKAELEINMYDALGHLYLYEGDDYIYQHEEPLVKPEPASKVFNYTVDLEDGGNLFVFRLLDIAGNETIVEIVIGQEVKDLPVNSIIVDNVAYDARYLDANEAAKAHLESWIEEGNPIYIKLAADTMVDADGNLVNPELPTRILYYDRNGNSNYYGN